MTKVLTIAKAIEKKTNQVSNTEPGTTNHTPPVTIETAPPTTGTKTTTTTAAELPPPAATKAETAPDQKAPLDEKLQPLDDRLHRLNELFALQAKFGKFDESLKKLADFRFSKTGDFASITITDNDDNDFVTRNGEVIGLLVEFLIKTITEKRNELADQIKW